MLCKTWKDTLADMWELRTLVILHSGQPLQSAALLQAAHATHAEKPHVGGFSFPAPSGGQWGCASEHSCSSADVRAIKEGFCSEAAAVAFFPGAMALRARLQMGLKNSAFEYVITIC